MPAYPSTAGRGWTAAQAMAFVAAAVLVGGLWWAPDVSQRVLWGGIIPVLPIVFLLHPGLWRNVCPLASVNMVAARFGRRRSMSPVMTRRANALGIALFAVLVPLRGAVFERYGQAAAIAALALGTLAVVGGVFFDRKAGFCNAVCPLLAVERLYGQAPLATVSNPRCPSCTLCVRRGCLDLSARKAVPRSWDRVAAPRPGSGSRSASLPRPFRGSCWHSSSYRRELRQ